MIYRCENCGKYFLEDEIEQKQTSYEEMYGVSDEFPNSHTCYVDVCPYCNAEDSLEEVSEEEILEKLKRA